MASVRISRVQAQSNQPATIRLSQVAVNNSPPAPAPQVRISTVSVLNPPQGDIYLMAAGVWHPAQIHVRSGGAWV